MLKSTVCRYEHFLSPWYRKWAEVMDLWPGLNPEGPVGNRKIWEWCAISQALDERGMLQSGKTALGFAVGTEPLPSVFASNRVAVLATDLMADKVDQGWVATGQHSTSVNELHNPKIVEREKFERLVSFASADMNNIQSITGQYDFLWSSCAFEHLGSIELGLNFVCNAMSLLKPGGVAVHTTEYNVSSDDETITEGNSVIFRKKDIDLLDRRLRKIRCGLEAVDWDCGTHEFDLNYDISPFFSTGRPHIKLELDGHVSTSFLVIVQKG